ncbi:TonB-dependent receptor [Rhizobium sp. CSW-27]|uniref:TonB-dependent receptor n=1 Tax=Rhizobium sp. CSW-27 TaxID=2839985 RepID=UPI002078525F|nr:TonB-dependent receptor [Rhizobium sp. CSW-27]
MPASAQTAAATATAQSGPGETRAFNIPAQSLASAISAFGRQSGLQVTLSLATAGSIQTKAVIGSFSPAEALARMLDGTGIAYRLSANGTAALIGAQQPADGTMVEDSVVLDQVLVTGNMGRNALTGAGYQGTPDWVYQEPASVSVVSRDAIRNASARNARDLLANTAGVLVSGDSNQNQGLNVNIRGLQDQNRVVTMIDGARQNFQRAGHGSSGLTYVDPALIRSIEVEKSSTSGAGGAGALAGSVNFRTIEADDLIRDGEQSGAETDLTIGTNEYHFSGSGSAAVRLSDSFALVGGISRKKLGEYEIGKNGSVGGDWEGLGMDKPIFTGSGTTSGLLKAQMQPTDDTTLDLSWLHYRSTFSQGTTDTTTSGSLREDTEDVTNNTFVAAFGWDPDSELIDLKARLWLNRVENDEFRPKRTDGVDDANVNYGMKTFGGSIENTSRFALPFGDLSLNYGMEAFRDLGKTTVTGAAIAADPNQALWYSGSNPSGRRDMISGFANATLDHDDWLTLSGGLRYDYYRLSGTSTVFSEPVQVYNPPSNCLRYYSDGIRCRVWGNPAYYSYEYPTEDVHVAVSDSKLLPTATIAVKPFDSVQIFGKYTEGFRPPTIMEALIGGSHVGSYGPANAPNPDLGAETANTYELGVNFSQDNVFQAGDSVRTKVVGFYREVDDYIALGTVDLGAVQYASYVNLDGTTRMRGIELEGNYDAGRYYLGGSFTYTDADYASQYTYNGTSYNTGQYVIFGVPKYRFTADAGVRFLEETLTIGARVTHVDAQKQEIGTMQTLLSAYATDSYTTLDIYGSYAINENTKLRFAVNNVTDVAYLPALGAASYPAPGRTATLSLNIRF